MSDKLKSCRICLIDNCVGGKSFDEDANMLELFEFCSGLHIGNSTPRLLCELCIKELQRFAKFKKKCTESEMFWESFRNLDTLKDDKSKCSIKNDEDLNGECNDFKLDSEIYDNGDASSHEFDVNDKEFEEVIVKNKTSKKNLRKLKTKRKKNSILKTTTEDKEVQERNFCGLCNTLCPNFADLNDHLSGHMARGTLKCEICDYVGRDFADMATHRYNHKAQKTSYACFLCKSRTGSLLSLQFHFRLIHLNKIGGWCEKCGKTFVVFKTWRRHMLVHKRKKELLVCDYCDKRFLYKYRIEEHIIHHLKKSQFVCETCGKGFYKKFNLKSHQRSMHSSSIPVKCGHCDKIYKNQDTLDVHMKEVTREKPYICELCSKGFSLPSSLKNHLFFHTGQKPFECDICGLKYKTKGSLTCHKLKHLGIFKHKCSKCVRSFATSVQLRRHFSVHTGVRKFKCLHCDKSFNERRRLETHTAKHREGSQVKRKS